MQAQGRVAFALIEYLFDPFKKILGKRRIRGAQVGRNKIVFQQIPDTGFGKNLHAYFLAMTETAQGTNTMQFAKRAAKHLEGVKIKVGTAATAARKQCEHEIFVVVQRAAVAV